MAAACGAALLLLAVPREAHAAPQVTSGLTSGLALTDFRAANGPRAAFHLGGRLDVLLGRSAPSDMAVGPYLEVMTAAFDTIEGGGGIAWLLPTGATGFVLSAGGFVRSSRFGVEPGVASTLFWGSRSFNYHSSYAIGAGLFAAGRYGLGDEGKQADVIAGVQLDLEYLALPFVLAYQAIAR
ncbi:MAG: hypothetical protein JWP97_3322 [Labilithrix sp.]|nr:hypothetical protein [Labilithrix sp.]